MVTSDPSIHFINVSYFFSLIYNLIFGGNLPTVHGVVDTTAVIWAWVSVFAFIFSIICIGILVYNTIRLHQTQEEIDANYGYIPPTEEHKQVEHSRWAYIRQLIESPQESDWRNAIIEADIMLDEILAKNGYEGDGVGEKLRTANPTHFHTLQDAGEAHGVRNQIAHQGSAYQLSPQLAYRTIGKYENVFHEFNEI
jgi:hypothetical protein